MTKVTENEFGQRYIFIGGVPRSGTTLLQNMLDSHPDILGLPEFIHLPEIMALRKNMRHSATHGMISDICSLDDIDTRIRKLIAGFMDPLLERYPSRFLVEKTPQNILVFTELMEIFPSARFIHIVRDPRAVVNSFFDVSRKAREKGFPAPYFCSGIREAIHYIDKCLMCAETAGKNNPGNLLTIIFSELVRNPKECTKKICRFLSVPWSDEVTHPMTSQHLNEKGMTCEANAIWYDHKSFSRNPEPAEIDKWRKNLSIIEQLRISDYFRKNRLLASLGFDLSLKHIPWPAHLGGRGINWFRILFGNLCEALGDIIAGSPSYIHK